VFSSKETDRKNLMDPLQNMTKFLEAKKSHKRDKERKHKDKHKRQRHTEKDSKTQPKKSVEQMRKERLRREQEEHERERKLLASIRGENNNEATTDRTHDAYRYSLIIFFLVNFGVYIQLQKSLLSLLIVSITKFSIMITSLYTYLPHNPCKVMWVSNHRYFLTRCL